MKLNSLRVSLLMVATCLLLAGCEQPAAQTSQPAASADQAPQGDQRAEVGVGKKGHYGPGIVTTPLSARFRAEEKLNFAQANHVLQIYKATHGKAPQSHEEYMEKIIKANHLKLPELPEGREYFYDVEKEELWTRDIPQDDEPAEPESKE